MDETLRRYIEEHNAQGFSNWLAQNPNVLLSKDVYEFAFQTFVNTEEKNLTNAHRILESLVSRFDQHSHLYRPHEFNRITQFYNLFKDPLNTAVGAFDVRGYVAKEERYQAKKTLREVYRDMDAILEQDLVYPIRHPEQTTFIQSLLRRFKKTPHEEVTKGVGEKFEQVMEKIVKEVGGQDKNKDLSEIEIRAIAYDRAVMHMKKYFKFNQFQLDHVLEETTKKQAIDEKLTLSEMLNRHVVPKDRIYPIVRDAKTNPEFAKDVRKYFDYIKELGDYVVINQSINQSIIFYCQPTHFRVCTKNLYGYIFAM